MVIAAGLLEPNAGLIFWIALTFLIFMEILRRFAWGPITNALTVREERISESMAQAERALAEAKVIQDVNTQARREAEASAQRLLRESRDESERLRGVELEKTKSQILNMQEQARQEIEREKDLALDSLRQEVADLAIHAAEKILRENLDAGRQKKIVDDFLSDLSKN